MRNSHIFLTIGLFFSLVLTLTYSSVAQAFMPVGGRIISTTDVDGNTCPTSYHATGPVTIAPVTQTVEYPYSFSLSSKGYSSYTITENAFFLGLMSDQFDIGTCINTKATAAALGVPVYLPTFPILLWGTSF